MNKKTYLKRPDGFDLTAFKTRHQSLADRVTEEADEVVIDGDGVTIGPDDLLTPDQTTANVRKLQVARNAIKNLYKVVEVLVMQLWPQLDQAQRDAIKDARDEITEHQVNEEW